MKPAQHTEPRRIGLWVALAAALLYCVWLGAHWLPVGWSDKELAASASRVWDIKREIAQHHHLPWWTPNFMSGSSYGLNHSRGFYLVPWILISMITDLESAGKLTELLAIFASAVAMYFCARRLLRNDWAAALSALAYMLHPEQIIRAAGAEHVTISLFFPFVPLLWLTFARALEAGRLRDICLCAMAGAFAMWTDNKQAVIHFLFLAFYLVWWLCPAQRRAQWKATARTLGLLAVTGLALGAGIVVPGLIESKYVKLFLGDPVTDWQRSYSFRSLFALVDRDAVVTRPAITKAVTQAQTQGVKSQAEMDSVQRVLGLQMDSPEKYAGVVLLAVIALTVLANHRRENRGLFWFFVGMLMLSVMLATGRGNVWSANLKTLDALSAWGGVPGAIWLAGIAMVAFLVMFARRKLTTPRKWIVAGIALAAFLALPAFDIIAHFPYFKDIRAPYSFYDGPGTFWVAILAGFFVTDVLTAEKWRAQIPKMVAGIAVLMLVDYWPYQRPMKENGVPARTLENLRSAYESLRADPDWVKTYSLSGRYFHLLGPMYGGKPQVWEAFYNWMAPLGIGLLNQHANLDFFNLVGARYIVFDKTDAQLDQKLAATLRRAFPVAIENDDFVVFRNDAARPYVSAYERACAFTGEVRDSPQLALALAANNWPLVQLTIATRDEADTAKFEKVYSVSQAAAFPSTQGMTVPLSDVRLIRENNSSVRVSFSTPSACWVVVAESYYPYWHAEVDGRPDFLWRISCGLMGVYLPPGNHQIALQYKPPRAYTVAGTVSLLALLACIGLTIRDARRVSTTR